MTPNYFGENLKTLRKFFGFTQLDLALDYDVTATLIGYYESGSRTPNPEFIQSIAERFGVSVTSLLSEKIELSGRFDLDLQNVASEFFDLFPLVSSEKALEDDTFKAAYVKQEAFYAKMHSAMLEDEFSCDELVFCLDEYESCLENSISKAYAAANLLSIYYLLFNNYVYSVDVFRSNNYALQQLADKNKGISEIQQQCLSMSDDDYHDIMALKEDEEFQKVITRCLKITCKSSELHELGSYFLVLQARYNIDKYTEEYQASIDIATGMAFFMAKAGNPYAKKYLRFYRKLLNPT